MTEGVQNAFGIVENIRIGNAWPATAIGFALGLECFFDVVLVVEFIYAVSKEKGTRGTESRRSALNIEVAIAKLVQNVIYSGKAVKEGFPGLAEIVHNGRSAKEWHACRLRYHGRNCRCSPDDILSASVRKFV